MPLAICTPVNSNGEMVLAKGTGNDVIVGSIPESYCSVNEHGHVIVNTQYIVPTRKKSEITYTFNPTISLASSISNNLINLIKGTTPVSGTLAPFFNTATNELNCYNEDETLTFKLNVIGSWSGGSSNRSMEVNFVGTTGNRLVESRDANVTTDNLSFFIPLCIDKNGNIATNGTAITIQSNGGTFNISSMLLIAEQVTISTEIL